MNHRCPPLRDLLKPFIDQPLQTGFLIAVKVAPKGSFAHPNSLAASSWVSRLACQPSYASSNRIFRVSCSHSVRLILSHLLTEYETGQITCYKSGHFICSPHVSTMLAFTCVTPRKTRRFGAKRRFWYLV